MATMSLPNVLSRLGGAAVSTSICLFRFLFWLSTPLYQGLSVHGVTSACTFASNFSGGSGCR
jgi:hypothetical protein